MLHEGEPLKLGLLAEIQRSALNGDNLAAILESVTAPLMAGLDAGRVTILSATADGAPSVLARAEVRSGPFGEAAMFEIAADGLAYGALTVERADPLTDDDRLFVSVAAGLLASAFIRLETAPGAAETDVDLATGRVTPMIGLIHRVRNILSVIRVIVRRTAERATSVEDYAAQLEGRISALARVQTVLITSQGQSTDLGTLIDDEIMVHSISEDRIRAQGPRIALKAKTAETIGLTVHELVENAIKFGALSARDGRIHVIWWVEEQAEPKQLRLEWVESGVPVLSAAPRVRGFGHELIERLLPYELSAKTSVDFQPGGFRCALAIPLNDRVISSDAYKVQ
jgi:two-component sensor histidine kinase